MPPYPGPKAPYCLPLFPDDLHEHALAAAPVEFSIKDLFPRAKIKLALRHGNDHFPPTSFQVSNIHSGTGATNVIPGEAVIDLNFRFSTESTPESLQARVVEILRRHDVQHRVEWTLGGSPFLTRPGRVGSGGRGFVGPPVRLPLSWRRPPPPVLAPAPGAGLSGVSGGSLLLGAGRCCRCRSPGTREV